jgi:hypothetical protein
MVYHIHTETPDGVSIEAITRQHVAEAYDHCRDRLNGTPDAKAVHLYLADSRIHTVSRRAFA